MIVCTKCGTRNEAGAAFCGGCGAFLEFYGKAVDATGQVTEPPPEATEAATDRATLAAGVPESPIEAAPRTAEPGEVTARVSESRIATEHAVEPPAATGSGATVAIDATEQMPEPAAPAVQTPEQAIEATHRTPDTPAVTAPPPEPDAPTIVMPGTVEASLASVEAPAAETPRPAGSPSPAETTSAAETPQPAGSPSPAQTLPPAGIPPTELPPPAEPSPPAEAAPAEPAPSAEAALTPEPPPSAERAAPPAPAETTFSAPVEDGNDGHAASESLDHAATPPVVAAPPQPPARRGGPSRRYAVTAPERADRLSTSPVSGDLAATPPMADPGTSSIERSPIATAGQAAPTEQGVRDPTALWGQPAARLPTATPPSAVSASPVAPPEPASRLPGPTGDRPANPPAQPLDDQPAARLPTEEVRRPVARPVTVPQPSRAAQPGDLICGNCGAPNEPSRHFCAVCGRSLASAAPATKKVPWWRRIFRRRRQAPLEAGERTAKMRAGEQRAGGNRLLASLRGLVLSALAVLVGFGLVGYVAVPSIRSAANDLIHRATSAFATPVHVYPDQVSGRSVSGHGAQFAVDKTHNLFWAGPLGGQPPELDFGFNAPIDLTAIIVTPGAETDINGYARPKQIQLTIGDAAPITRTLNDAQLVDASGGASGKVLAFQVLDVGGSNVTQIKLQVLSVYPGKRNAVAIGEVEFVARP